MEAWFNIMSHSVFFKSRYMIALEYRAPRQGYPGVKVYMLVG